MTSVTERPAEAVGTQRVTLVTLTAMVVGGTVGAGVFSLPRRFAEETGVYGALIAWGIAGTGMLMLAFVFGNVTYWVLITSTVGNIAPGLGEGDTLLAVAVSTVGIWVFAMLVVRGVRDATAINRMDHDLIGGSLTCPPTSPHRPSPTGFIPRSASCARSWSARPASPTGA